MGKAIVVLNSGSSSIKFSLFLDQEDGPALDVKGQVEGLYTDHARFKAKGADGAVRAEHEWIGETVPGHDGAIDYLVGFLRSELADDELVGFGHRVVHGGMRYTRPVRVDADTLHDLERFVPLAPLHQPNNLFPIRRVLERMPDMPQVACFDTAFHSTVPEVACIFAIPAELTGAGVRRYGFHGLSYEYIASILPGIDRKAAAGRTVALHLGNGASMCAMDGGRSVASTMGFTAVDGLPMGTRCGSIDPGVILFMMDHLKMDARSIEKLIYKESGLLGVSGISSDMRVLLESASPMAKLAIDQFVYRIRRELGGLAAALGGLDAIVFTAGIGENSTYIRRRVLKDAAWLGVAYDEDANSAGGPRISTPESRVAAWVIPTDEELMIARHTRHLINTGG